MHRHGSVTKGIDGRSILSRLSPIHGKRFARLLAKRQIFHIDSAMNATFAGSGRITLTVP
jgi:hypothetical protein